MLHRKSISRLSLLAIGAVVVASGPVARAQGGRPPTAVRVEAVELETLQERRRVTGELRAVSRSRVATMESGLVLELPVREGSVVQAGDVLAALDSRRLEIELRRHQAEKLVGRAVLTAREASEAMKQRDVDALRTLQAQSATNPKELADADAELLVASAQVEAARRDIDVIAARVDLLDRRLADMKITAPFAGVVVGRNTERGEWVAEGDAIVEIVSIGSFDAWLDVPQRFAPAVAAGNEPVQVRIDATGETRPPQIPRFVPLVDPKARTFRLIVRVEDKAHRLASGMSVTGWVPTGRPDQYLTVPRNAILRNQVGPYVFQAQTTGEGPAVAQPVQIDILFEVGDRVAVPAGQLAPGDLVVVEGNERLFPRMPISFTPPGTPHTPGTPGTGGP